MLLRQGREASLWAASDKSLSPTPRITPNKNYHLLPQPPLLKDYQRSSPGNDEGLDKGYYSERVYLYPVRDAISNRVYYGFRGIFKEKSHLFVISLIKKNVL